MFDRCRPSSRSSIHPSFHSFILSFIHLFSPFDHLVVVRVWFDEPYTRTIVLKWFIVTSLKCCMLRQMTKELINTTRRDTTQFSNMIISYNGLFVFRVLIYTSIHHHIDLFLMGA